MGLGIFMFSAGLFDVLIDHPGLYIRQHIASAILRRFLIGLTMGLTALGIFKSGWGIRSGAYINPAVTIVRYRLGEINITDTVFYILFQFAGGTAGMYLIYLLLPSLVSHPAINYIVTVPGKQGIPAAFIAEFLISWLLISVVLVTGKYLTLAKYTAYLVALLITLFITFEAPFSGMSMNPARTFASAIVSNQFTAFWLYCLAPILGMLTGQATASFFKKTNRPQ